MKGFGIIFFAALVAYTSAWEWGDPIITDYPDCVAIGGAFHHEFADTSECKCFYECNWDDAIRHCCGKDNQSPNWNGYLVYNVLLQVCDHCPNAIANGQSKCAGPCTPTV